MRSLTSLAVAAAVLLGSSMAGAAQIEGDYLEARSCLTYTGPCFANGEMELAGKEALLAWKVDKGSWNGVPLAGLGAALVVKADSTLGNDGVFNKMPDEVHSIILVDEQATPRQQEALVDLVKSSAHAKLSENILKVKQVPFTLTNNPQSGEAEFAAGKLAKIETRGITAKDCVCSNEKIFYQPLADVANFSPAYTKTLSFQGQGLDHQWTQHGLASAYLATFRR